MKIRLKNCWKHRDMVIQRCKKQGACVPEFRRLTRAKTEQTFRKVLLDNLCWVVRSRILDTDLYDAFSSTRSNKNGKEVLWNVLVKQEYKGTDDWWMNEYGELVAPYRTDGWVTFPIGESVNI